MSVFRIFNYILVKLSSMIMFNSDLIQTMIHFLFAIAILLLLSMTRHPASVFTARFQDCEFVYHVLAQVVTMLHLTQWTPLRVYIYKLLFKRKNTAVACGRTDFAIGSIGVHCTPLQFSTFHFQFSIKKNPEHGENRCSGNFLFIYFTQTFLWTI